MVKKHKFNAVDAAILIVIAAVIAAAAFLLLRHKPEEVKNTTKIEYVVEFREVREEFADNIKVGDLVVDSVAKYHIGEVTAVSYNEAIAEKEDMANEQAVVVTYPGYIDIQMTVVSDATIEANSRFLLGGGYDVSVGTEVNVRLPYFNGSGYCIAIRDIGGEGEK